MKLVTIEPKHYNSKAIEAVALEVALGTIHVALEATHVDFQVYTVDFGGCGSILNATQSGSAHRTSPHSGGTGDRSTKEYVRSPKMLTDDFQGSSYDRIGLRYAATRQADPRIATQIHEALGDARTIVNVGAGTGAYEPCDRDVLAIEPSQRMIAQRAPQSAPVIRGYAESLPLETDSVDVAMACLTLHHWADWRIGVQELRRVARKRIVIFTYDHSYAMRFWLLRDYLPKLARLDCSRFPTIQEQRVAIGDEVDVQSVPLPHDCEDGFLAAYWRRPRAYLDEQVRAGISTFQLPGAGRLLDGLQTLAEDLQTGRWEQLNQGILEYEKLDLGYRLLVTEL